MKQHIAYAAITAVGMSLAGFEVAAQPHQAPAGQVQKERAASPTTEKATAGGKPSVAESEPQSLEEAILRTLRRQGIDVRILDEKDKTEPVPAQPHGSPASLAALTHAESSLLP